MFKSSKLSTPNRLNPASAIFWGFPPLEICVPLRSRRNRPQRHHHHLLRRRLKRKEEKTKELK